MHEYTVRSLWSRSSSAEGLQESASQRWRRALGRDGPDKPAGNPSMGKCLLTRPVGADCQISNEAYRWAICKRLGPQAPGTRVACHRQGRGGQGRCKVLFDRDGKHAISRAHGMLMQRHNHIRNFLVAYAKRCGATVHVEQRTGLQIRENLGNTRDAEAKPPIRTADIRILDSDGCEVWVDMRVTAVSLGKLVGPALREAERAKRAEYGRPPCPDVNLHDGLRLFVLEQHGRPGDQASALGAYFVRVKARQLSLTGQSNWLTAHRQAEQEFWPPTGCLLCKRTWEALRECKGG